MTQRVYLSLGSNVGDREAYLRSAVRELADYVRIAAVSSVYATEPVGVTEQPRFLNLAVAADTELEPHDLLSRVKAIERNVGRTPTFRWGPRVVDIDILLYGDRVLEDHDLTIPHREMPNRAFVLVPLAEIACDVLHPALNLRVCQLLDRVPGRNTVQVFSSRKMLFE